MPDETPYFPGFKDLFFKTFQSWSSEKMAFKAHTIIPNIALKEGILSKNSGITLKSNTNHAKIVKNH